MVNDPIIDLEDACRSWARRAPTYGEHLNDDAAALRKFVEDGAVLSRWLPAKTARSAGERAVAERVHDASRRSRVAFLRRHVREVHRSIVTPLTGHISLSGISAAAATRYPGLLPTPAQLAQERHHLQRDKEGLEIDQALFFSELLRDPWTGLDLVNRLLQPTAAALDMLPVFQRDRCIHLGKVELDARGPAAHLTFHNPACLNAEDDELIDQFETAVDLALLDDAIAVGLLRGGEMTHPRYLGHRVFSAGINLKELHRGQISYVDFLLRREFGTLNKMLHGLRVDGDAQGDDFRTVMKPWVAAVDAFAIGGGAQVLLACDYVIAAANSYFALPAAQEGIVPGVANLRLPRIAGARLARQIILTGRRIWAGEPDAAALFDEVVEPADMDAAIAARLAVLVSPAVIPNRRMLVLCEEPLDTFRAYMAQFALEQGQRLYSHDVLQKVAAA
jgi:(3,5-dihydroxyphenyl)acetyl-CoA 1,2-dioxygenase